MDNLIFPHHFKEVTRADLENAVKSYREGLLPDETKSCIIQWSELKHLIATAEKVHGEGSVQGLRVYFYRADDRKKYPGKNQEIRKVGDKTQLSIILVPMNKYEYDHISPASAQDMFDKDGKIFALIPGGEHTGLCPTNCGGSI